jgi:hypothetical protein
VTNTPPTVYAVSFTTKKPLGEVWNLLASKCGIEEKYEEPHLYMLSGQNNELAKTISTCAIWFSVACILTFGIFRMNANGEMVVFFVLFCLPLLIVVGAVKATMEVWKSRPQGEAPTRDAPASASAATPDR